MKIQQTRTVPFFSALLAALVLLALPAFFGEMKGSAPIAPVACAAAAPAVPRNLQAAVYGESGIRLTWTASAGATQYYVYRYNGERQDYVYIGTANKAAFYDGNCVPGVTYYYKVCSVSSAYDTSGLSSAASRRFVGAPAVPQNVYASVYNSSGLRLTWKASPGAAKYYVYRYNGERQDYVYIGTANKAAYYDGRCVPGVTYYYKVRAIYTANGINYYSGLSSAASRQFLGAPAVPKNVKAVVYNASGIRLSWTASSGANRYYVYRYNSTRDDYMYIGTATKAAYYDGNCVPGVTYYYKIRALYSTSYNTYTSGYSAAASVKAEGKPAAPKNLKAVAYDSSGIRLSWTASSGATKYYVYRYNSTRGAYVYIGTAYKAAYYDGGRSKGVTYYYKVRAVRSSGGYTYESGLSTAASASIAKSAGSSTASLWGVLRGYWNVLRGGSTPFGGTHYVFGTDSNGYYVAAECYDIEGDFYGIVTSVERQSTNGYKINLKVPDWYGNGTYTYESIWVDISDVNATGLLGIYHKGSWRTYHYEGRTYNEGRAAYYRNR